MATNPLGKTPVSDPLRHLRSRTGPLRRNSRDLLAQLWLELRVFTPWCRCDCQSESKMEIPVKKKIPAKPDQTLAARDPLAYIVLKAERQNGNPR